MSNHEAWRAPDYAERGVLIAGGTSGVGLATAMAFALKLVELLAGPAKGKEVAAGLLYREG